MEIAGLSLCIQGTRIGVPKNQNEFRFIPVYTGNTKTRCSIAPQFPVYPCVYREHLSVKVIFELRSGLSLCIQGTQNPCYTIQKMQRFIPVYTGNTY